MNGLVFTLAPHPAPSPWEEGETVSPFQKSEYQATSSSATRSLALCCLFGSLNSPHVACYKSVNERANLLDDRICNLPGHQPLFRRFNLRGDDQSLSRRAAERAGNDGIEIDGRQNGAEPAQFSFR